MEYKTTEASAYPSEANEISNIHKEIEHIEKSLKNEYKRIAELKSQLHLTSQQTQLFTKEQKKITEEIKDVNWKISKEMIAELRKINLPSKHLTEVCEKVLVILGLNQTGFNDFRDLIKNFNKFKNLISSVEVLKIPGCVIKEVLPIWKNQNIIQNKLIKVSKCGCLLARWIFLIVDICLKSETITSSEKTEQELEKKILDLQRACKEFESHLDLLKGLLDEKKTGNLSNDDFTDEEFTQKFMLVEEAQSKSKKIVEENFSFNQFIKFPDFQNERLYDDKSIKIQDIAFEGFKEDPGCCRMNFFCF